MLIPLHIRSWFDEQAVFLTFSIKGLPHVRPISIEGLVDTGSPWLAIAPEDCKILNLPLKILSLPPANIDVRMAGIKFRRMITKNVEIVVQDSEGNPVKVKMPYISILVPTRPSEKIEKIPSVVGMDFIKHACFTFHYEHEKKEAYFER